jgi:hypothetical protein
MSAESGCIEWPQPHDDPPEVAALYELVREQAIQTAAETRASINKGIDDLLINWPEDKPRPTHPGTWRPSLRSQEIDAARPGILVHGDPETEALARFYTELTIYESWLQRHMIIDAQPANMIKALLMASDRGGRHNLRHVAFTKEEHHVVARRFEQGYLGLDPVAPSEDDSPYALDTDLRISEDRLYAEYGFDMGGERTGGLIPTAALATALKTSPEELNRRLETEGIRQTRDDGYHYTTPWNMIRTGNFLVLARPYDEDPSKVLVGPVRELTAFGAYILEDYLAAYEAGTKQTQDS